ncbi:MAG: MFS transporter [Cyclobacteriaceae bacterium]|nr:MFS transporter [Cyclobacteriaceae bacterium]
MSNQLWNRQYAKFSAYGFLKNLRFFDAFFILFLLEKNLSYTEIGILYASREIIINIFEIPSGLIADTYGRKNSLIASFFFYILSFIIFYTSSNFWMFLVAFLAYGIADAFRTGTHKGMIMDYLKLNNWQDQKINYYGHTRAWSQKGSAISSLVAGVIVFYSGSYQAIFLYSIIPYILNLALVMSYPKSINLSHNNKGEKGEKLNFKQFFDIIKQPNVLKIINASALHTAYLKAVKDYIQPLMVSVSLLIPLLLKVDAEKKNGLIVGVIYFFIYLGTSRVSQLASKVAANRKEQISYQTLVWGFVFGISCGFFFFYELWVIALFAFIGIYLVENMRKPILTAFIADNVPNEILVSVISMQSLIRTVITAILALVFGILADAYGIGVSFIIVSSALLAFTFFVSRFTKY